MNLELEELEESEPRKVSFGVCCPVDNSRTDTLMESAYRPLLCLLRAGYADTSATQASTARREERVVRR